MQKGNLSLVLLPNGRSIRTNYNLHDLLSSYIALLNDRYRGGAHRHQPLHIFFIVDSHQTKPRYAPATLRCNLSEESAYSSSWEKYL